MITSRRRGSLRRLAVAGAIAMAISAPAVGHADPEPAPPQANSSLLPLNPPAGSAAAAPSEAGTVISTDPYTNPESQHATEVEADTINSGSSVVSAFQVGRNEHGGAANIGWAASGDGGKTWGRGFLRGITDKAGGPHPAASDPVVAVNQKFRTWLISSLAVDAGHGVAVYTSRAGEGQDFGFPIRTLGHDGLDWDKNWITCDNNVSSPFYGNCYTVANLSGAGEIFTSVSTDGGLTWSAPRPTADRAHGVGVQPVVRPNGELWVVYLDHARDQIRVFRSVDGGATFSVSGLVGQRFFHPDSTVRDGLGVPSVEVDGGGIIYAAWPDCRSRPDCSSNDIFVAHSTPPSANDDSSGQLGWSEPTRVPAPARAAASLANTIIPGICADPSTSGATARLSLYFYWVFDDGFIDLGHTTSTDGGNTWALPTIIDSNAIEFLPRTPLGRMVGDYLSCSVVPGGLATTAYAMGQAPTTAEFNVPMRSVMRPV